MVTSPGGLLNFRDAGGHPTPHGRMRTGRLFRSEMLMRLEDPGVLAAMGIAAVVDLRSDRERLEHPTPDLGPVRRHDITIDPGAMRPPDAGLPTLDDVYRQIVDWCAPQLVRSVELVAEHADVGVLVHCTGGKDRTGVVIGLVHELLGVPDEILDADYARSEELLSAWSVHAPANMMEDADWEQMVAAGLLSSPPGTMVGILERLRREHGSVEAYLTGAGLAPSTVETLRLRLVEP